MKEFTLQRQENHFLSFMHINVSLLCFCPLNDFTSWFLFWRQRTCVSAGRRPQPRPPTTNRQETPCMNLSDHMTLGKKNKFEMTQYINGNVCTATYNNTINICLCFFKCYFELMASSPSWTKMQMLF